MPNISVILPVYNGEKTIQETIESVLKQTFFDLELIVINDGSTDATLKIISHIQDSRLKLFSYPNAGPPASRNRGINHAVSKYISFIDADDLWIPDKLEVQHKALEGNPQAAVAYSWTDLIDESGKFLRRGAYTNYQGDVYTKLLLNNFLESGSNPLIRSEAFREVGYFDESLTNADDWDMWLRLAARYSFVVVPSIQIFYRVSVSSSSTSSNVWGMESCVLQVLTKAYAQAPQSVQHLKQVSLANSYKYLTFKALTGFPARKRGLKGFRFLWNAIKYDLLLVKRKIIWKVLLRIFIFVILPPQQAKLLISKFSQLTDITTLLKILQFEDC